LCSLGDIIIQAIIEGYKFENDSCHQISIFKLWLLKHSYLMALKIGNNVANFKFFGKMDGKILISYELSDIIH
jgi:hypothetical protein